MAFGTTTSSFGPKYSMQQSKRFLGNNLVRFQCGCIRLVEALRLKRMYACPYMHGKEKKKTNQRPLCVGNTVREVWNSAATLA